MRATVAPLDVAVVAGSGHFLVRPPAVRIFLLAAMRAPRAVDILTPGS
jgi:hypothetical protein